MTTCHYCGDPATTVDHVIPQAFGGPDTDDNKVPACLPCNIAKGSLPVEVFKLTTRERSTWLKTRGWERLGANSWLSPDEDDRAFYTKAAALRHEGFVRSGICVSMQKDPAPARKPPLSLRCGLKLDGVYALGLRNGNCPVGFLAEADEDGVTLVLYDWMIGMFVGDDLWVAYNTIEQWKRAEKLDAQQTRAEGWGDDRTVFGMDPLGAFQTRWNAEHQLL